MAYGERTPPPADAPVAPPDLIGASLFIGLVAVLGVSREGFQLIAVVLDVVDGRGHHYPYDVLALAGVAINSLGFVASLWFLSLRRWAWRLGLAYVMYELGLRAFFVLDNLDPGIVHPGVSGANVGGVVGQGFLFLVFLVLLGYMLGGDTRALLDAREAYRLRRAAAPVGAAD